MDSNPLHENIFKEEMEWMPAEYVPGSDELNLREIALYLILQSSKYDKLEPFVPYLAVNFFDRFITRHELPGVVGRVQDDIVLAAHSCLIMAWKMRDLFSFSFLEFVEKRKLNIDFTNNLVKMEFKILEGLNSQKMRTVTPISFVDFLLGKMPLGKGINRRTINQIIIETQDDINFTRLRPSVIAAAALLAACRIQYPEQYKNNMDILLADSENYLIKSDVESCSNKTFELCKKKKILMETKVGFLDSPEMDPEMNFELKWRMNWSSEDPEESTIDVRAESKSNLQEMRDLVADDVKYMPLIGYSDAVEAETNRRIAFSLLKENLNRIKISKVTDPYCSFLTINLFDCYASRFPPESDVDINLIIMSCLCMIWELTSNYLHLGDFAVNDHKFFTDCVKFESKIRNELSEITRPLPIKEIFDYFLSLVNESEARKTCLKYVSRGKMLYLMQQDIRFTQFRPSTVAAAAILTSILQVCPINYPKFKNAILTSLFVDEGELLQCVDKLTVKNTVLTLMKLHSPQEEADKYSTITDTVHVALREAKQG